MSLGSRVKGFSKELGITFWLQVAVLATAAASVEAAGWVESPPLILVVFLAVLTAALLVNLRKHRIVHHLWAVLAGGFLAYLGGLYLTEADQWYLKFSALHGRLAQWWSAVVGEDATTDTLPLSVTIIAITWLAAYFTSWGLFRHRNVWASLLPVVAGTVINLTYLPERFSVYLFVLLFIGLLMLVQVTSLRQRALLQARGVPHPTSIHRLSLAHGLWLSVIILGITVVLPIGDSPAAPLKWVFRPVDRMVDNLQDELYRIFAAVPGYNLDSIRFFGSVLPLMRPVPMGEDPVMFADAWYPLYWPAIAYDQYTSKAWKVEDTESSPVASLAEIEDEEGGYLLPSGVASIAYEVHMYVNSPYLLVAGEPFDIAPDAQQVLPASKAFQLDLASPGQNGDLPLDLQKLASTLAASTGKVGNPDLTYMPSGLRVSRVIKELSPSDRKTTTVNIDSPFYYSDLNQAVKSQGEIVGVEVVRPSLEGSPVFYGSLKRLRPDSEYRIIAGLSTASEEALRNSPREYSPEILDRYLQLPNSLPSRVVVLAQALAKDADNPYDKAVAIESYLRTLEYTTASQTIPHDADTVDYFLFESKEGYSDYFASAMAMMLRTQGIPTRLVLGFGPGEGDSEKQGFLVRDKDSHSWPEVYFPDLGWVPFEPTPIYGTRARGLPASPFGIGGLFAEQAAQEEIDDTGGLLEPEKEQKERDDMGGPLSGGQGARALPERYFGTPLGMGGALFALFLLIGAVLMRFLWMRQYGGLRSPQAAYERMHRLATFLGFPSLPSQTAFEFSHGLSQLIPEARADVDLVSNTFVRQRYGGITPSTIEELRLIRAWRRIKRACMAHLRQTREPTASPG